MSEDRVPFGTHDPATAMVNGRTDTPTGEAEAREEGWVVGNADGTKWRHWFNGSPEWVDNQEEATRYFRRCDAEAVHREDEDAWSVRRFAVRSEAVAAERERAGRHVRSLKAALRVSRGWVITCSESAQAKRDLNTIDAALAIREQAK